MKKIWKLSVCTLAAAFTLSAVTACGGEDSGAVSYITAEQAYSIGEEVIESLEGTKSFEFGLSMSASETMSSMVSSNSMDVKGVFSIGEENIDGKISSSMNSSMSMPGMPAFGENESSTIYMIDGYQYVPVDYDEEGNTYVKMETTSIEEIVDEIEAEFGMTLEEIFGSVMQEMPQVEIPEEAIDFIKELINKEFTMVQTGNTTRITLNVRDELVEILGFVGGLNANTKIGSIVNYALGRVEQGLTWESILDDVKGLSTYTVSDAVTFLDAEIYAASEMHLQDVKDMLFAETDIYYILADEFGVETADMAKDVKISDLVAEYGELTIDDLVQFIAGEDATFASYIAIAEDFLKETTLGEVMGLMGADALMTLQQVTSVVKGINIGALDTSFAVTVVNGKATRIEYSYNMSVSISYQGQAMSVSANILAYAEKFSNSLQEISLPDDIMVINEF